MTALPTVSVIIPTLDRGTVLCQTLDLLLAQDPQPNEILVMDQTAEHPPEAQRRLQELHDQGKIRWFHLDVPLASRARNRGILEASSEVLLFLDDDVTFDAGFVAVHLRNYSDPGVISVSGRFTGELDQMYELTDELPPEARVMPMGLIKVLANFARRIPKLPIHAGNLSVRRRVALAAGGFDENFGRLDLGADTDFGWQVGRVHPGGSWHDPSAALFHLKAPRGGCRRIETRWHLADPNEIYPVVYFFCKNFSLWTGRREVARMFRGTVLNRYNVYHPWWLPLALWRYFLGVGTGIWASARPPRDLTWTHPDLVQKARQGIRIE